MQEHGLDREMEAWYDDRLSANGPTARGVGYQSDEAQRRRFVQLAKLLPPEAEGLSVNDYGCGLGAFAHFLAAERSSPFTYFGFDTNQTMVDLAVENRGGHEAWTFSADASRVPIADYTVASAVMNLRFDVPDGEWRDRICALIDELAAVSRCGFTFNILTKYSDIERMEPELYYADPAFFFDRCMRRYGGSVALLHDYGEYEFTVIVRTR
jgi:SAM-dependent methyltransferase